MPKRVLYNIPQKCHGAQVTVRSFQGREDTACIVAEGTERIRMKFRIGGLI